MTIGLKRMWINQPSTLQPLHAKHGTNVLAEPESDNIMRIYFLSGDVISQNAPKNTLSEGWQPDRRQAEVVEVVTGLHNALTRMIDTHNPDSIEAEWLGHSNELIRNMTGRDVRIEGSRFNQHDNDAEAPATPAM